MLLTEQTMLPWLRHTSSLTDKLKQIAGDARLDVISQKTTEIDECDRQHLMFRSDETKTLKREIVMWAFDVACWYARTIIPFSTYEANSILFDRLKTESLGALLFQGDAMHRRSLNYFLISDESPEYAWVHAHMPLTEKNLWLRSSEWQITEAHSFCLVEIFLPGLMRYAP